MDTGSSKPAAPLAELRPMLLAAGKRPFSHAGWAFEVMYDGYRTLAEWGPDGARLQSRNGTDVSSWFSEVTSALAAIGGRRCVIDGEICVLNEQGFAGHAEFRRLFRRQAREGLEPGDDTVVLCAFDVLVINGHSIMHRPLLQRKWHLAKLLANVPHTLPVGEIVGDGMSVYKVALQMHLEGIVAKKLDAPYQPGVRSPDWLKIKRPSGLPAERSKR